MRNLLLGIIVLSSTLSFGQFQKKTFLVSGKTGSNLNSSAMKIRSGGKTNRYGSSSSISVGLPIGYFPIDRLLVGLNPQFSSEHLKWDFEGIEFLTRNYSIDLFSRYYIDKGVFFGASYGIGTSFEESILSSGNVEENTIGSRQWRITIGYAVIIKRHVGIEPEFGYSTVSSDRLHDSTTLISGFIVNIGLSYYFH